MKKIGMVVAIAREIRAVFEKYGTPEKTETFGSFSLWYYQNEDYELIVMGSGAGEIGAASAVQHLISAHHVDMILNYGVVGGLTPEMALSNTVLVHSVVHYDMDTSACDDCEPARYLELPDIFIPADQRLLDRALSQHPELSAVVCASADKFVADPDRKKELHERFGAKICDMESAGIALTCLRNQIPCLMVKTVSDSIGGGAGEFERSVISSASVALDIADRIMKEIQ